MSLNINCERVHDALAFYSAPNKINKLPPIATNSDNLNKILVISFIDDVLEIIPVGSLFYGDDIY